MDYSDDDVVDIESGEDNLYSDYTDYDEFAEETSKQPQVSYVVLKEEDIHKRQRGDIEQISTLLSISQVEAIVLLLHYRWSVGKVEDEWFTDEERVRKSAGIFKEPVVDLNGRKVKKIECGICFESYRQKEVAAVSCGHPYCNTCWTGYVTAKISDGPGCLMVKCPEPRCSAAVGRDMIDKIITKEEDKEKYRRYFLRSYVEESGNKIKWCPSPGCGYAIDFGSGSGSEQHHDVTCLCSYDFCWNCNEEAHRPVACDTVSKWVFKNNDESENTTWILANSKPCPKCKRQIEKNEGCMHMTCAQPCGHEFCWLCLRSYEVCGGGGPDCHKFQGDDTANTVRERAKHAIDRYMHHYERWASNQSSRLKAMGDLKQLQSVQLKELCDNLCTSEAQLQFTVEAWLQIIECRRVLKWTYAYGYYLPKQERVKKQFFEYLQGEAETGLERLHHCAEKELTQFLHKTKQDPSQNFDHFRSKLTHLTKVTKTYFENLVKALENDLADVLVDW